MTLHISNLDLSWSDDQLAALFSPYGAVRSAEVAIDGFTGTSRGFGWVQMEAEAEAIAALTALHGSDHSGRILAIASTDDRKVQGGSYKVGGGPAQAPRFRKI